MTVSISVVYWIITLFISFVGGGFAIEHLIEHYGEAVFKKKIDIPWIWCAVAAIFIGYPAMALVGIIWGSKLAYRKIRDRKGAASRKDT